MDDGSKSLHKFTDLCREIMWFSSTAANGTCKPLFDAIVPIVSGPQQGSAIITYPTNIIKATFLIWKYDLASRVVLWVLEECNALLT
jgi:hypothetical protein